MPLTVTTDLTVITTAETITGWSNIGSQSSALEPDFFAQGSNSVSRAVSATIKGMVFDNGSAIDFTTGTHKDKLVYIWMRCNTPSLAATRANGGIVVRLCTGSATTNYREWYVDGSDTIAINDGWVCYVIDPQSAGTATTGSYNANSVRYFGGTMNAITTAKGQNFGIDQISYGRGELYVSGTNTVVGEGFKEIADVDFGNSSNRWGIITVKAGVIYVRGKIIIGHTSSNTDFSSRNETVVFETTGYRQTADTVKSMPDASVGGTNGTDGLTTYSGLAFRSGTGTTTITFGVAVGSDNGRSGSTFSVATNDRLTTPGKVSSGVISFGASGAIDLNVYSSSWIGFENVITLMASLATTKKISACTFNGCGRIRAYVTVQNCIVLNSVTTVTDGAVGVTSGNNEILYWSKCLFINNNRSIVFETGANSPYTFTDLNFSGNTFDVRNESGTNITINVSGGGSPTKEEASGTVTVVNSKNLTIEIRDSDGNLITATCEVTVVRNSDTVVLYTAENVITGSTVYSFDGSLSATVVYINIHNVTGYQSKTVNNYALPTNSETLSVQLDSDPFYSNL